MYKIWVFPDEDSSEILEIVSNGLIRINNILLWIINMVLNTIFNTILMLLLHQNFSWVSKESRSRKKNNEIWRGYLFSKKKRKDGWTFLCYREPTTHPKVFDQFGEKGEWKRTMNWENAGEGKESERGGHLMLIVSMNKALPLLPPPPPIFHATHERMPKPDSF